jgi:hypothetical protein
MKHGHSCISPNWNGSWMNSMTQSLLVWRNSIKNQVMLRLQWLWHVMFLMSFSATQSHRTKLSTHSTTTSSCSIICVQHYDKSGLFSHAFISHTVWQWTCPCGCQYQKPSGYSWTSIIFPGHEPLWLYLFPKMKEHIWEKQFCQRKTSRKQ